MTDPVSQTSVSNKKVQNAWAFYDWANSVYPLVITTAVFPNYYEEVTATETSDIVNFLGFEVVNSALFAYALSFSYLFIAILSPFLSGIADYSGKKKGFMKFFAWTGAFACSMLYFFTGPNLEFGIAFFVLASIGFAGSLVFYNAYLPEIAPPEQHDRLSARGFSFGYIGSVLLLGFNLWMIMAPGFFGIADNSTLPARISFLTVGLWWFGFSLVTFYFLPSNIYKQQPEGKIILKGFRELKGVWNSLTDLPLIKQFLLSFFVYSVGLQTVISMATIFGTKAIGLETQNLIISILIIQLVAVLGATFFARLSGKIGNVYTLIIMVIIWTLVTAGAYFVYDAVGFYVLAFLVGIVMGGVQSLSRSTYSKFLPPTKDHASFFSFYDITEKLAIVLGTFAFGLIDNLTGNMRNSVLVLITFFIIGLFLLFRLLKTQNRLKQQHIAEARQ